MIQWHEVTWYSRWGAIILFLAVVPALCFYIGTQYQLVQQESSQFDQTAESLTPATSSVSDSVQYQTYVSQKYAISMEIPKDWVADPNALAPYDPASGTKLTTLTSPDFVTQAPPAEGDYSIVSGMRIYFQARPWTEGQEAKRLQDIQQKEASGYYNCGNCLPTKNVMVDGQNVAMTSLTGGTNDAQTDGVSSGISVYRNGQLYSFSIEYNPSYQNYRQVIDTFLRSIKFL